MMTRPVNIYTLSRIRNREAFNLVEAHHAQKHDIRKTPYHEMLSLRTLADAMIERGCEIKDLDGFFFSFEIPQIGKEFDLLKLTDKTCLNIELKSEYVTQEKILNQLRNNRHYLGHLGRRLQLYSVITDSLSCFRLSLNDELIEVDIEEIISSVKKMDGEYISTIDDLFRASDYLVSPFGTPERFIRGEYFLTQAQDKIKRDLFNVMDDVTKEAYFHLTGKPGTGKTLLLYDIAKTLSKNGNTLIIHSAPLSDSQKMISSQLGNFSIIPVSDVHKSKRLHEYNYVLVDESHRISADQFDVIAGEVKKNRQICIFSSDPRQILSYSEKLCDIEGKIHQLPLSGEFILSEKIRTNRELYCFIRCMLNLRNRPPRRMTFENVELNFAQSDKEAESIIEYYREKGYTFINYSKTGDDKSPCDRFSGDVDIHDVIGQEFDSVVMLMDSSFFYDEKGILKGIPHPDPDYIYPNLFYQAVTRVREDLSIVVLESVELFKKIVSIVDRDI